MQVIPKSNDISLDQVRSEYRGTQSQLSQRLSETFSLVDDENVTSLNEQQRETLKEIALAQDSINNKLNFDSGTSLYTNINSRTSGLDENQQTVLTASLNGLQKALGTFADTVANVFGVNTRQTA